MWSAVDTTMPSTNDSCSAPASNLTLSITTTYKLQHGSSGLRRIKSESAAIFRRRGSSTRHAPPRSLATKNLLHNNHMRNRLQALANKPIRIKASRSGAKPPIPKKTSLTSTLAAEKLLMVIGQRAPLDESVLLQDKTDAQATLTSRPDCVDLEVVPAVVENANVAPDAVQNKPQEFSDSSMSSLSMGVGLDAQGDETGSSTGKFLTYVHSHAAGEKRMMPLPSPICASVEVNEDPKPSVIPSPIKMWSQPVTEDSKMTRPVPIRQLTSEMELENVNPNTGTLATSTHRTRDRMKVKRRRGNFGKLEVALRSAGPASEKTDHSTGNITLLFRHAALSSSEDSWRRIVSDIGDSESFDGHVGPAGSNFEASFNAKSKAEFMEGGNEQIWIKLGVAQSCVMRRWRLRIASINFDSGLGPVLCVIDENTTGCFRRNRTTFIRLRDSRVQTRRVTATGNKNVELFQFVLHAEGREYKLATSSFKNRMNWISVLRSSSMKYGNENKSDE